MDQITNVPACDLAFHIKRIDGVPERHALFGQLAEQIVGDRTAAFTPRAERRLTRYRQLRRQIVDVYDFAPACDHEPFNHVLELTHGSGPGILAEDHDRFGRDAADHRAHLAIAITVPTSVHDANWRLGRTRGARLREILQEVIDEERNVLPTIAEGWNHQPEHVDSVEKVF